MGPGVSRSAVQMLHQMRQDDVALDVPPSDNTSSTKLLHRMSVSVEVQRPQVRPQHKRGTDVTSDAF